MPDDRAEGRIAEGGSEPRVHPTAWRGDELFAREDFEWTLTEADNREIDAAVDASGSVPVDQLDRAHFELPLLGPRLQKMQHGLEHGSGVARVRGLRIADRSEASLARVFRGVASHIGTPVSQSAKGERLLHVRDEGFAPEDPRFRGPHSNRRLSFHTDRCDVIGFLCVRPATEGGDNDVISSMALRDEMRSRYPEVLRELEQPFAYLRHSVDSGNERPFTMVPVFTEHEGVFAASLLRVLIDRADRSPDAPNLTDAQRGALDTLETVAEDASLYARFRQEAGDLLFLNNWVTFHRRTEFVDDPDPRHRRHLMRLWLSVPNSRALDPRFREHFGATAAGALRGGMRPRL